MELHSTQMSVNSLIKQWSEGDIQLPPFQRPYVWRIRKTLNLLDSLYRQFPIGSFYLWKPSPGSKLRPKRRPDGVDTRGATLYLIDGQQRLTSLAAAMGLTDMYDERTKRTLECALELTKDDSQGDGIRLTRLFHSPANRSDGNGDTLEDAPIWVPLRDLPAEGALLKLTNRKEKELKDTGKTQREIQEALRRIQIASDMLKRTVPVIVIQDASDSEVIAMFKRLNGGAGLKSGDIQAADLSKGPSITVLEAMRQFVGEDGRASRAARLGFNFSFAFRALVVFHLGNAKFKDLKDDWAERHNGQDLKRSWDRARSSLAKALEFADVRLGWSRCGLLPSANALIPMAFALDKANLRMNRADDLNYTRWLCLTAVRGVFQGAVETTINTYIRRVLEGGGRPSDHLWNALPRACRRPIKSAELMDDRMPTWGGASQVMLAWLVSKNAKDWKDGSALKDLGCNGTADSRTGSLTIHHILPREQAKQSGIEAAAVHSVANYAIIHGDTNSWLNDEEPFRAYDLLTARQRKHASVQFFDKQAVELFEKKGYEDFRKARATRIAAALNEWLQLKS